MNFHPHAFLSIIPKAEIAKKEKYFYLNYTIRLVKIFWYWHSTKEILLRMNHHLKTTTLLRTKIVFHFSIVHQPKYECALLPYLLNKYHLEIIIWNACIRQGWCGFSFYRFDTTGIGKILYRHMQAKLLFELGLNKQVRMNHTKSVMHDGFLYWGVESR